MPFTSGVARASTVLMQTFGQLKLQADGVELLVVMEGPVAAHFAQRSGQGWPSRCRWPSGCGDLALIAFCMGRPPGGIFDPATRHGPSERQRLDFLARRSGILARLRFRCRPEGPHGLNFARAKSDHPAHDFSQHHRPRSDTHSSRTTVLNNYGCSPTQYLSIVRYRI